MSKKDFKKGIAAQAKIDAAKEEKIAKGLKAHGEILNNISEHQNQIQSALDIIIEDWADSDASDYGLDSTNLPSMMDSTEKRVLCACIFTLLSSYEQNSEAQQLFYNNLEEHLGISERVATFDFDKLQKIDSVSDRLKILQVICAFLFLHDESFEFLRDRNTFNWLFALAPVKDIANTCKRIDFEYNTLGIDGIVSRYKADSSLIEKINVTDSTAELPEMTQDSSVSYEELISIIHSVVDDESSFGKRVQFSESDFDKEIKKDFPTLAYDSLVATNRIGNGCIIFTTHAFYLKKNKLPASKYIEVPYKSILVEKMHTKSGKKAGTRCLVIVYKNGNSIEESLEIDDGKLIEEKLKDLLLKIIDSGCKFSETDKLTELSKLDETLKTQLLSVIIYALRKDKANITEAFCLAEDLSVVSKWNECYSLIQDDADFSSTVKEFCDKIPYPSQRYISTKVMYRAMKSLACSNMLRGLPLSQMNSSYELKIKEFDVSAIGAERFNKMMSSATDDYLKDGKYYSQLKKKYKLSSFEGFADIELGLDDLIELCDKKQKKKMVGVIAGAAVGGPIGAVAVDVGGKIIGKVKKQKNNDVEK
ncbi:hypothetical protein [Butyrivibrio sp. AE2032]|uniref:hypothetical protein n=1 Tax=Butyrivibrio sp. AE2032 TaxID=1458463 RepID=UPI000550A695|nr:hypothetical protein [Butyrivibrio sp. AE2032]